jgi:transposase
LIDGENLRSKIKIIQKKNKELGRNEIVKCKKCELEIDRDLNLSRNICILNIETRNDDK